MPDPHTLISMPLGTLTLANEPGFWTRLFFRNAASEFAPSTDFAWYFILITSVIAFVILMAVLLWFGIRYTKRPGSVPRVSPAHNTKLEIVWSVIPAIGFAAMFFIGLYGYVPKLVPPSDAEEVFVTAQQWMWTLDYQLEDGTFVQPLQQQRVTNQDWPILAFPVGRPIKVTMTSKDVIHSFSIPDFRVKRDVFPNRYTTAHFTPTGPPTHTINDDGELIAIDALGNPLDTEVITGPDAVNDPWYGTSEASRHGYYLFCTEYCGDQHSQMSYRVVTLNDADYRAWLNAQADSSSVPLVELGQTLYGAKGCAACHSVDGSRGTGPTWKNIWGETHQFTDGTSAVVDLNYIRESILEPGNKVVAGWPNQMQSYQGQLNEREILALAMYMKSLSDSFATEALQQSQDAAAAIEQGDEAQEAAEQQLIDQLNQ